ncbi:polysaccharide biosynthesis tyrosine autokinase [Nocardioides sp. CFH 31398]|uniref:tyrosine-protein kinase domain-containing protein n=1 Tax=Nocardioides sp. CFH 31398 TaxID=2919579 RepID=UPI001F06AD95|nr:polysaccharide biosynthesis tyrosine autokinase [Nocardioides sp. CFH 31398]MCH1867539.1 polysaccharide biosynthesis tyrosine autokinase [Nocardioides sp. CFH 31398]
MTAVGASDRPGLRDHARALRRRWRTGVAVLLLCVGLALAYSLAATPTYAASADVLLEPSGPQTDTGDGQIDAEEVATQTQVVTSLPVARLVQSRYGLASPPDLDELVTVQAVGTSRVLRITAQDSDADRAARTASVVATAYLQFREQDSVGSYEQARERLASERADVETRLGQIDDELADQPGQEALASERRTLLSTQTQLDSQADALTESLTTAATGGELLRNPEAPEAPVTPQTLLNVVLGGLVGLVLGVGAALLRDRLDDKVHEEATVHQTLGGAVLGRVPEWRDRALSERVATLLRPHDPVSEEYQRLAANLRFVLATRTTDAAPVVLMTSAQQGEGKTVTSANLAVAAARLGLRVVLVDGDLRRAAVAPRFGLGDPPGLSDLLASGQPADTHLLDVGVDDLRVLAAGTPAPNPAALLSSPRMGELLDELVASADLVVVDSPPVLLGADTLELVTRADLVVAVTRVGVTRRRQLVALREALRTVGVTPAGVVLNGVDESHLTSYDYRRARPAEDVTTSPDAASPGPAEPEARLSGQAQG